MEFFHSTMDYHASEQRPMSATEVLAYLILSGQKSPNLQSVLEEKKRKQDQATIDLSRYKGKKILN